MLVFLPILVFSNHLENAKQALRNGNYQSALASFELAAQENPSNSMIFFRRATTYLQLGKTQQAIDDFSRVLELGENIQGSLDESIQDFTKCNLPEALDSLKEANLAKQHWMEADGALQKNDLKSAINSLSDYLAICPMNIQARIQRGTLSMELGDFENAIADFSRTVKIKPDLTDLYLKLSQLHLKLGEIPDAVARVKECLRLDPDQKKCKQQYKTMKKLEKALANMNTLADKRKWRDVLKVLFKEDELMKEVEEIGAFQLKQRAYSLACKAYHFIKKDVEAITWCSKTLELNADDLDALIYRADSYSNQGDYQEAISDYQKAHQINRQDPRIHEGYSKAQRLLKKAGMKDYYKILDVSRTATTREIKKMAQIWHPDKYKGDLSKEEVQKKMSDINTAYEVLSNDELRERYDNGDDPNDPRSGQRQQDPFSNFPGGFGGFPFEFGGGGPQFHFKFN